MPNDIDSQITNQDAEIQKELPANGGVPTGTTDQPDKVDAESLLQEQREKYERDISQLKSSLQKQIAAKDREIEEARRRADDEVAKMKWNSMNEEERSAYQQRQEKENIDRLIQENNELRVMMQEQEIKNQWYKYFTDLGVPVEKLVMDREAHDLVESGMAIISSMLKNKPAQETQQTAQPKRVNPPAVANVSGNAPSGNSLKALADKYGGGLNGLEKAFSLFEQGVITADAFVK